MPRQYANFPHCRKCDAKLSDEEKYYSNGTCPYCGETNDSDVVICTSEVYELVPPTKWWHRLMPARYRRKGNQMKTPNHISTYYCWIREAYGDRVAHRSQVPLINHINEGLLILDDLKANWSTKAAFCLHPLLQSDSDLIEFNSINNKLHSQVVILAMEYRAVANAYLSPNYSSAADKVKLSCLPEVNLMLIADKIQNYKDFRLHNSTVENADRLTQYFRVWLRTLGISSAELDRLTEIISQQGET